MSPVQPFSSGALQPLAIQLKLAIRPSSPSGFGYSAVQPNSRSAIVQQLLFSPRLAGGGSAIWLGTAHATLVAKGVEAT
jgi:hypothetical protein